MTDSTRPVTEDLVRRSPGGWTGALVVAWAVLVLLSSAAIAGSAWVAPRFVRVGLQGAHVELVAGGGDGTTEEDLIVAYTESLGGVADRLSSAVLPWSLAIAFAAVVLLFSALRLVCGTERGRRWTRGALVVLAALAAAAAVHTSNTLLPDSSAWTAQLCDDVVGLFRLTGEGLDAGALAAIVSSRGVRSAIWGVAVLTALPSAALFLFTGTAHVRAWCASRTRTRA